MKNELICGFLAKMQKTCDYIRAKKEMIRLDFFPNRVGFKNNAFQSSEKSILKALVKPLCEPLLAFISSSLLTNTFFTRRPSRKNQWVLLYMLNLSKELFSVFLDLQSLNRKVITLYLYARQHDNLAFLFFWLLTLTLNFTFIYYMLYTQALSKLENVGHVSCWVRLVWLMQNHTYLQHSLQNNITIILLLRQPTHVTFCCPITISYYLSPCFSSNFNKSSFIKSIIWSKVPENERLQHNLAEVAIFWWCFSSLCSAKLLTSP